MYVYTSMKKILVIQNKRIGDVLIASVIAQNIKKVFPKSQVDYLVYDYTADVIRHNPAIDNIIEINEKELKKADNLIQLALKIRKDKYDIIFDPYAKLQSRVICLLSKTPTRIGFKKREKKPSLNFYTHNIPLLKKKSKSCGKAIEDRVNMVKSVFDLMEDQIDYEPKIVLTEKEKNYNKVDLYKPCIMLGVLGSTPQKTMPYDFIVEIINFITNTYNLNIIFNYAPHQKDEALIIYNQCEKKDKIIIDIYEDSVRGLIKLLNQCQLLVGNEGGVVHIAKALNRPTFTIFSPYVNKDHWATFEDGKIHQSIHLLEEKPNLYDSFTVEERRKIEKDPHELYKKLTPDMIIPKLKSFLEMNL